MGWFLDGQRFPPGTEETGSESLPMRHGAVHSDENKGVTVEGTHSLL